MVPQRLSMAVMCVMSIWTIAAGCGERQEEIDGQCCDLCRPGTHRNGFCTKQQTDCKPCGEGYYSDNYNLLDRCEDCRSCQHDYVEKCTPTTNAKCSCRSGFLCSDNFCSKCEKNQCVKGEKLKKTESAVGHMLIQYSYTCEPQPPNPMPNTNLDVKEDLCKTDKEGIDSINLTLSIGFVLTSLTLLVLLSYAFMKKLRKHKEYNYPMEVLAVSTNANDFHLSKEESGRELMEDESKSNSLGILRL
ncbi:tumor necrosis factor receptor superfamily member 6-like [Clinocottus analis]|uniref:tumor necrosis factor receptor superfamily member 6-like n=1 Tax=Clinocottus analis TaxID=304258 RepID=UPI0035C22F5C